MIYDLIQDRNNRSLNQRDHTTISSIQKLQRFKQQSGIRTSRVSTQTRQNNKTELRLHSPKFARKPKTNRDINLPKQIKIHQNRQTINNNTLQNIQNSRLRQSQARNTKEVDNAEQKIFNLPIKFYSPKACLKLKTKTQFFNRDTQQLQAINTQSRIETKGKNYNQNKIVQKGQLNEQLRQLRQKVKNIQIELKKAENIAKQKDKKIQQLTLQNRQVKKLESQMLQKSKQDQNKLDQIRAQKVQILKQLHQTQTKLADSSNIFNPQSPKKSLKINVEDQDKLSLRLRQLEAQNQMLHECLNKLTDQSKYYQIELSMLRKKKNDLVSLQIKNLRLTEKNKQLQTKASRFRTQLDKARSPPKKAAFSHRNRKQSGDSIFSLSPDHSLDNQS